MTLAPTRRRLVVGALLALLAAAAAAAPPAVAIHYGQTPPLDELAVFDVVVVEPDHGADPAAYRRQNSRLYAYVSVGEIHPTRAYAADLPATWRRGVDAVWQSIRVDVSQPGYADFFADRVVGPLWRKGFRGFFLDTLDSYRRLDAGGATDAAARQDRQDRAMQAGLVRLVETLHARFPGIRLIANRGFELLPAIASRLEMVAAESLFRGYDAPTKTYGEVAAADREWLLARFREARQRYGLPGLAIDYVPPADRALARRTAERIVAEGLVPWVADAALGTLGVGAWEVLPRRVLMLYDGSESPVPDRASVARYAALPLEYQGYVPEYRDLRDPLPAGPLAGRYAGVVVWPNRSGPGERTLARWLLDRIGEGTKVAFFGQFGFSPDAEARRVLGLADAKPPAGSLQVVDAAAAPLLGFETAPRPARQHLVPIRLDGPGRPLLTLADRRGERYTAAALTPWGGYVLDPFATVELAGSDQARWVIDPFEFLRQALALPAMPVPDPTTDNGRRLLTIHIDGDGYPSRAELPGAPFAGAALKERVLERYRLPTTLSVIEAEVAPHGLHPQDAPALEDIARASFALPHVEIASHSFSHPFRWSRAEGAAARGGESGGYHLDVPGYAFDLRREIEGSVAYLRQRLAPPGKPVGVFLWSGDAEPTAGALAIAEAAGLLNLNGGMTWATRANPSLTAVSPLGVERGGVFQTFAPVMNENVYTNLWSGPFYGYANVIETFELTGAPRRLKPIGLYYHAYSASKRASLAALDRVYAWALAQSPHPVFASDYVRRTRDFRRLAIGREVAPEAGAGPRFRVAGGEALRTLRLPAGLGAPDLAASPGVAGFAWDDRFPEQRYLHQAGGEATLAFAAGDDNLQKTGRGAARPYLFDANARLAAWRPTADGVEFGLAGQVPLEFSLGAMDGCTLTDAARRRPLAAAPDPLPSGAARRRFRTDHAAGTFAVSCRPR